MALFHAHHRARRAVRLLLLLALMLAAVGALAWNAWDADRARRAAAWRTVGDYADFSATLFASNAEALLAPTLLYAFYPAELAERQETAEPVSAAALANPPEAGRCASRYPGGRWYARLSLPTGDLDAVGPLPAPERAWLAATLRQRAPTAGVEASPLGLLFPPDSGGTAVVAYRVRRDPDGSPVEVHALAHCFESRDGEVFALATEQSALLPPALVGDLPADSLLAITVTSPRGDTVFRSSESQTGGIRGHRRAVAGGALDGLDVTVSLRPDLADALVIGGIPPSRLPRTLGLLALAGVLITATLLQLGRAIKLVRLRERFVADVSHELRTPLQQILLYVQLLRLGQITEQGQRDGALAVVERETLRLVRMVERVLAFARGPRKDGTIAPADEDTDLSRLAEALVGELTPMAANEGATLRAIAPAAGLHVRAQPEMLRQILVNLVENALKYGPPGQRVTVRVERDADRALLAVEDQGPGVPVGERERVWEAFYRLEREERAAAAGTGIGLSIVRRLVVAAGGTTRIEDAPGGGARVIVALPLAPTRVRGPGSEDGRPLQGTEVG